MKDGNVMNFCTQSIYPVELSQLFNQILLISLINWGKAYLYYNNQLSIASMTYIVSDPKQQHASQGFQGFLQGFSCMLFHVPISCSIFHRIVWLLSQPKCNRWDVRPSHNTLLEVKDSVTVNILHEIEFISL